MLVPGAEHSGPIVLYVTKWSQSVLTSGKFWCHPETQSFKTAELKVFICMAFQKLSNRQNFYLNIYQKLFIWTIVSKYIHISKAKKKKLPWSDEFRNIQI